MDFSAVKEKVDKYVMNSYSRFNVALESGKGAKAYGCGKSYIDFGSGIGVNALGYCDGGWVKAVSEQAAKLSHCSNLYYTPIQGELAELLCKRTGFKGVFFCNSGAEANEGAIKLARKYSFDKYGSGRATIVTLKNSFHGRTVTTLSATGQDVFHNFFFPFTEGFKFAEAGNFDSVKEACTKDVCAVLMEPIQGEGGVLPLDTEFVKKVADLCREKDILLMFDEVQTGIGRTGKFLAHEHFGVKADVVSCAKALAGGLPMGAVLCRGGLENVLSAGTHATTFGGNPIACAGALEVVKRVSDEKFLKEVTEKGEYIKARLSKIDGIGEIRGKGLMLGFDVDGVSSKDVAAKAAENGLLILTAKTALRMLPPLTITKEEIDCGLDILEDTIKSMK
ncbi:Acetylornithine aminotransferase [[Clostridium] cellulosi]|jgi:acetylornithine aminotransferase apoenzyme (EC 2.6.1.11)|uniref:Acetylornithine aminotransferase n=1 Tax=[Clostridium] cellulosi TaxID=29343 RepID=A0A078KQV3_9FIRM|nr:Acetylornithine aminotransferase [[Clostridium] cellulosi]